MAKYWVFSFFSRLFTSKWTTWACITKARREPSARTWHPGWSTGEVHLLESRWGTWCDTTWKHHHRRCPLRRFHQCQCPCHLHPLQHQQILTAKQRTWTSCLGWLRLTSTSTVASFSRSPSLASSWCTGSSTATSATTWSRIWCSSTRLKATTDRGSTKIAEKQNLVKQMWEKNKLRKKSPKLKLEHGRQKSDKKC